MAGIVQFSLKIAASKIGAPIKEQHLAELASRLHTLECGKILIRGFIRFQYKSLSRDCKPHQAVFSSLFRHNLEIDPFTWEVKGLSNPSTEGCQTLQEKEKEKVQDQEGVQGEKNGHWQPTDFQLLLGSFFRRRVTTPFSDDEMKAFRKISQPEPEDLEKLKAYYRAEWPEGADYRFRDLGTLLRNFNKALDRARQFKPNTGY